MPHKQPIVNHVTSLEDFYHQN